MQFTAAQVESLAPKPAAYKAALKIVDTGKCSSSGKSERALWGEIQGSGKKPYKTQIDLQNLAYKCSCPSRQFPCKHALAILTLSYKTNIVASAEPEWVSTWIAKRREKQAAKDEPEVAPKILTAKEIEGREKQKNKRVEERLTAVNAGVEELQKWLEDIVRIGLIELPNRSHDDFKRMAARMVDSKATGLTGWVRALGDLNYTTTGAWQEESLSIIAKLNLLIQAWKNHSNLSEPWQATVKNLVGWNQSTKDLKVNKETYSVKDEWLVLGKELETIDEIVIQREWLWGCNTGESVLILNFGTRFHTLTNSLLPASLIEAEVAYFPAIIPHRGIIRLQNKISNKINTQPTKLPNLNALKTQHNENTSANPWTNNTCYLVEDIKLVRLGDKWSVTDRENNHMPLEMDDELIMKWFLYSGNQAVGTAIVHKQKALKVLGIFSTSQYIVL